MTVINPATSLPLDSGGTLETGAGSIEIEILKQLKIMTILLRQMNNIPGIMDEDASFYGQTPQSLITQS